MLVLRILIFDLCKLPACKHAQQNQPEPRKHVKLLEMRPHALDFYKLKFCKIVVQFAKTNIVYCLKHRSFDAIDISLTVGISTFCVPLPLECCCFFRCALDTFSAWNRTNSWINFQTQKFEFKVINNMVHLIYQCKSVVVFFKIQIKIAWLFICQYL